jgi:YegS/Rv2252/BmrU family lipid kinase
VIHNPVAGRRRRKRFQAVLDLLERDGDELSLRATEAPGDATRLARQIDLGDVDLRAGDLVVAAGGDGTINEVINGLVAEGRPAPAPLAIVPLGTSNVLAAEIGLGRSPEAVARTIREGAVRSVSLGRITGANLPDGRCFILMAGAGVDAHAVADVDPGLKRRFAQGAYVWAGLQAVFRSRGLRYVVEVDGVRHEAASVIVAKAAHYGGPFIVAKQARLDDPRFQVCLFERTGFWPAGLYGLALALGRLDAAPGFTSVPGRKVRITAPASQSGDPPPTKPAEPVQCDGDDVTRLPVEVEVVPEALGLVVPREGPYG